MKKIIAAFDGLKFSESTRDYAIYLAKQSNAHLVGVFLEDFTYQSYKVYDLIREGGENVETKQRILEREDHDVRASAVHNFETACGTAGVEYTVHHDKSIARQELLHESIYADLLIICIKETLTHYTEKLPTRFIRDLLTNVQCPVMVVPQRFKTINNLVLLFDGEPSSVHAIKMFSYILPFLKDFHTEVLTIKPETESAHVPDNRLVKEFMKRHFPAAEYSVINGRPEVEIEAYLKAHKENSLVVLGANRRNEVSRWFRESMADSLMKSLKLPLFIAHNK